MAEPILPDDFILQIAELERRLFILESTARVPQVTSAALGGQSAEVLANESTNSTSYTNLGTAGPSVTVNVTQSGLLTVLFGHDANSPSGVVGYMAFELSGANVRAPIDSDAVYLTWTGSVTNPVSGHTARAKRLSGLQPGPTTVTTRYRSQTGGGAWFAHRWILALPL